VVGPGVQTTIALAGRVAIVTGARRGIGYDEALALGRAGATVVVVTHTQLDAAERVAAEVEAVGGTASAALADVTRADDVQRLVETTLRRHGTVDILVNNAGMTDPAHQRGRLVDLSEESWDRMLAGHLKSTFLCIKYAAPVMMAHGWGRIVNTASIHGRVGGREGMGHYGAAKAGIIALTRTAARELGPYGITCNAIAPGFIATEQLLGGAAAGTIASYTRQNPLGRLGTPQEIANLVLFLASEGASYINGAVVDCSGGRVEYSLGGATAEHGA